MQVEVRCCCVPKTLLGWIELPEHRAYPGGYVTFALSVMSHDPTTVWQTVQLRIGEIYDNGRRWPAFDSNDTPIEILRRIRGFKENKE